jgi:peroxin-6
MLQAADSTGSPSTRLVKVLAWERLDAASSLPSETILLSASTYRSLAASSSSTSAQSLEVLIQPTPFGARRPTLPAAKTVTIARIATTEGVDKRYERAWVRGLRNHFARSERICKGKGKERARDIKGSERMVKRGDIIAVPVWQDRLLAPNGNEEDGQASDQDSDSDSETDSDDEAPVMRSKDRPSPTALVYFIVTALSYEPLLALEDDFRSSVSSKARAGEMGCWVDVQGGTRMVLAGVERTRLGHRGDDIRRHGMSESLASAAGRPELIQPDLVPKPYSTGPATKLRDLLLSTLSPTSKTWAVHLSVLIKGARGSGKLPLVRHLADQIGFNVVHLEGYDIIGDTPAVTEGTIRASVEKAKACAPAILVITHVEALAKKNEAGGRGMRV